MPEAPKVSVIIPVYNCEKYVGEAIESVLAQTYRDFELIVVNDGSTDGTPQILDRYTDSIRRIDQANTGRAGARNAGIRAARGAYIAFLDSDDLWLPQKLARQVPLMERDPDVGVVFSNCEFLFEGQGAHGDYFSAFPPHRGRITAQLLICNFAAGLTLLVRREALEKAGGFYQEYMLAEDFDLLIRLSAHYSFDYAEEPLGRYRVHPENTSRDTVTINWEGKDSLLRFAAQYPEVVARIPREFAEAKFLRTNTLATSYLAAGRVAEARREYIECLRLKPQALAMWGKVLLTFLGGSALRRLGIVGKNTFMSKEVYEKQVQGSKFKVQG